MRWRAFGVAYSILWLPVGAAFEQDDAVGDLRALYALSLPAGLQPFFTKLKVDDGCQ